MSIWSAVSNLASKALPFVKDIGKAVAGDILGNIFVGQPNADRAFEQSYGSSAAAFDASQQAYAHRYQMTTEDMKAAGLNPILAASGGFSVGNAPTMATAQAFQAPPAYGYSTGSAKGFAEARKTTEETKKVSQEISETISKTSLNIEKAKETMANTAKIRQDQKVASEQERKIIQEVFNLEQEFLFKVKEFEKIREETQLISERRSLTKEETRNIQYERSVIQATAKTLQLKLNELSKVAKVYEGTSGQIMAYLKEIVGMVNLSFGLFGGFGNRKKAQAIDWQN